MPNPIPVLIEASRFLMAFRDGGPVLRLNLVRGHQLVDQLVNGLPTVFCLAGQ